MRSCIKSRMKEYKHQFVLFCLLGKEKDGFTIEKRLYNGIDGHSFFLMKIYWSKPSFSRAKAHHGEVKHIGPLGHTDKTDKTDRPIQRIFSSDFFLSEESVHEKASMGSGWSSSSSAMIGIAFMQPDPWQLPHANEHFIPCFLQVHRAVLQSVVHLQWMTFSRSEGAGERSVVVG